MGINSTSNSFYLQSRPDVSYSRLISSAYLLDLLTEASQPITFSANSAERMRITSAGSLVVGGTEVVTNNGGITATTTSSGVTQTSLAMRNAGTGNGTGSIFAFRGKTNTGAENDYAYLTMVADDTTAKTGSIRFATGNGTSPTERMRIDSAGIVTMSAYGSGAATFSASGVISSVSDETWKTKDGVPSNPDAMLQKLEPGYWYYNDEKKETFGSDRQLGFYAQNVNAAIGPEAAPEPEEGKPWGYYDRSVLAVTVMSLQKALLTIESLKARLDAANL
jgi:hypothetical protein